MPSPRPLADRIKDEPDESGRSRVLANGIDDFRVEFLGRLADLLSEVTSLRRLFYGILGTFMSILVALVVLILQVKP